MGKSFVESHKKPRIHRKTKKVVQPKQPFKEMIYEEGDIEDLNKRMLEDQRTDAKGIIVMAGDESGSMTC